MSKNDLALVIAFTQVLGWLIESDPSLIKDLRDLDLFVTWVRLLLPWHLFYTPLSRTARP